MMCNVCGATNEINSKFCQECGSVLEAASAQESTTYEQCCGSFAMPAKKSKAPFIAAVMAGVLAITIPLVSMNINKADAEEPEAEKIEHVQPTTEQVNAINVDGENIENSATEIQDYKSSASASTTQVPNAAYEPASANDHGDVVCESGGSAAIYKDKTPKVDCEVGGIRIDENGNRLPLDYGFENAKSATVTHEDKVTCQVRDE